MVTRQEGTDLLAGRQALERGAWSDAQAAFEAALEVDETPEAHEGLGLALWFDGRPADGIAERERAFVGYARTGRAHDAARMAVWVSHQHLLGGRPSAARGWLARAERAVEDAPPGVGHGWVAVERARHDGVVAEQIRHATVALESARSFGADDLEVFALSLLGRCELVAGHRAAGLSLLEEAMAAASVGRVRNVHTLGEAYCNLVVACAAAGEWELAAEWCAHVEEFARTHHAAPLFGACRTVHADVLLATGHWPEAEQALEVALRTHRRHVPEMSSPTVASLAELRVEQGRLQEAEQLLAGREEHPASLLALALLRTAEARPAEAVALLERGLRAAGGDVAREVRLLAALVDASLAAGDLPRADAASEELHRRAAGSAVRVAGARADLASARVHLAAGRSQDAVEPARRALAEFGVLAMPLDAGRARLELARATSETSPEVAADEARAALSSFRTLGARRAAEAAAGFLRTLGRGTPARPRVAGDLTAREQEVLSLLAMGMSNGRIAATLTISERTAEHHVSHILTKLGAGNRAEAAAYAARLATGGDR